MILNDDYIQIVKESNYLVALTDKIIDIPSLISFSKDSHSGALSLFIGTTRDNYNGKNVIKLDYEYHPSMCIKYLNSLALQSIEKYKLNKCVIVHRVKKVPISEESIVIIASSNHRKESLECCSFIIEEVKRIIPIWKKEYYDDGTYEWKENCCK